MDDLVTENHRHSFWGKILRTPQWKHLFRFFSYSEHIVEAAFYHDHDILTTGDEVGKKPDVLNPRCRLLSKSWRIHLSQNDWPDPQTRGES